MVEFRYNISALFPQPIIRVTSNLLPHTFRGDRREALDAAVKMSEIIDRLGQLSAVAQKLNRPVTTSQRVRMSENQTVYLLADVDQGQHGVVVGMLKIGTKDLYLFDESGETRKVEQAPCILDFYIHESRQRHGLGKQLFQTMLGEEKWTPLHCCVDRPSEKLLGFLRKHYSLQKPIPQANNFVVYEGFFGGGNGAASHHDGGGDRSKRHSQQHSNGVHHSASPNTQLFGNTYLGEDINKRRHQRQLDSPATVQVVSPAGRYGARRPTCSMAEIIHSNSQQPNKAVQDASSDADEAGGANLTVDGLTKEFSSMQTLSGDLDEERERDRELLSDHETEPEPQPEPEEYDEGEPAIESLEPDPSERRHFNKTPVDHIGNDCLGGGVRKTMTFQLSKQHTGMKNVSYGVGQAVAPTNKMEFDQEQREDFGVVKINRPIGKSPSSLAGDGVDNVSLSSSAAAAAAAAAGLTDQGYNDLKFYHNKLW